MKVYEKHPEEDRGPTFLELWPQIPQTLFTLKTMYPTFIVDNPL